MLSLVVTHGNTAGWLMKTVNEECVAAWEQQFHELRGEYIQRLYKKRKREECSCSMINWNGWHLGV